MNIYVANINFKATEEEIRELFEQYGNVNTVRIVTDRETGKSRGFGFVDMPDNKQARAAMDALDRFKFQGRELVVNEAKPPKNDKR